MGDNNKFQDVSTGGDDTKLQGLKSGEGTTFSAEDTFKKINYYNWGARNRQAFAWDLTPNPRTEIGLKVGDSRYDTGIVSTNQLEDIENTRGLLQPWWDQIGAGVAKMGILAGTTFLNSTVGLLTGVGTAIGEGRWSGIWDNEVNKVLNNVNKWSEEYFKNHYTNDERENPYSNIFSGNFIGDMFLKNMGFTMGAIGAGALTGGFSSAALAGVKGGALIAKGLGTAIAASGEASIEALNAAQLYKQQNDQLIDTLYKQSLADLQNKYTDYFQALDKKYANGDVLELVSGPDNLPTYQSKKLKDAEILKLAYIEDKARLDLDTLRLKEEAKEKYTHVGNITFGLNQTLLALTDNIQFGRVLSGGFRNARRGAALTAKTLEGETVHGTKNIAKGIIKGDIGFEEAKGFGKAVATYATTLVAAESFEEGAQNAISNTSQIYESSELNKFAKNTKSFSGTKLNPYVQDNVDSVLSASNLALLGLFGTATSPGWMEVLLGGLTGLVGVPFFKRGKKGGVRFTWAGGVKEAIDKAKEDYKANEVVDEINRVIKDPNFVNRYLGLIRHNNFQALMDEAVDKDNSFEFANHEHSLLISDVMMFHKANQIDALKELYKGFASLSDEDIESIKKGTYVEEAGEGQKDDELKDLTKQDISERAKKLSDLTDDIIKIHSYHLVKYGDVFNKNELEDLTWMQTSIKDHERRFDENMNAFRDKIAPLLPHIAKEEGKEDPEAYARELLSMSNTDLYNTLINKDNGSLGQLYLIIGEDKERYDLLLKDTEILLKEKDYLEKKGKSRAKKLGIQLEGLLKAAKEIEEKGFITDGTNVSQLYNDALASVIMRSQLVEKYNKAIEDPKSLKESIQADTKNAENTAKIKELNEDYDVASKSENIFDLKKNISKHNPLTRFDLLTLIAKDDNAKALKHAKELLELDNLLKFLGHPLRDEDNHTDITPTEKDMIHDAIAYAYKNAESVDLFHKLLRERVTTKLLPKIDELLEEYNDLIKRSKGEEGGKKLTPPTVNPVTPPVVTTEEDTEEKKPTYTPISLGAERFNHEDLLKALKNVDPNDLDYVIENAGVFDKMMQDLVREVEKNRPVGELLEDLIKDPRFDYVFRLMGQNNLEQELSSMIDYIKNKKSDLEEESDTEETPDSDLTKDDDFYDQVDDHNNAAKHGPNTKTSIRSDATTEADIDVLKSPKLKPDKGRRAFVPRVDRIKKDQGETLADIKARKNINAYKYFINYLLEHNAFDFVNKGKLAKLVAKNKDTKIHFIVDQDLNDYEREGINPLAYTVLLAVEADTKEAMTINGKKYQIVGAIKPKNGTIVNKNATDIVTKVIGESTASGERQYVSDSYSTVEFIYPGLIATSKEEFKGENRSITREMVANGADGKLHLGLINKHGIAIVPDVDSSKIIDPENKKENIGRKVIAIQGADGHFFITPVNFKKFTTSEFSEDDFNTKEVFIKIKDALSKLFDTSLDIKSRLRARDEFEKYIYLGKRIGTNKLGGNLPFLLTLAKESTSGKHFIAISRRSGENEEGVIQYESAKDPVTGKTLSMNLSDNFEDNFTRFMSLMDVMQPEFLMTKKGLNDEELINEYLDAGIIQSNIAALQTFNANFTIHPIDANGKPVVADTFSPDNKGNKKDDKGSLGGKPEGTEVKMGTETYTYVSSTEVYDAKTGKKITDEEKLDLIYAHLSINSKTNLIATRKGTKSTLYSIARRGIEYGALVSELGTIKLIRDLEYKETIKLFDAAVQGDTNGRDATDKTLKSNDERVADVINKITEGIYKLDVEVLDKGNLTVFAVVTNQEGKEIVRTIVSGKLMLKLAKAKTTKEELDKVVEEYLIGMIKQEMYHLLGPDTNVPKEIISDEIYNDFIDKNIVPDTILDAIVEKYKNHDNLSPRELAIASSRMDIINERLKNLNKPKVDLSDPNNFTIFAGVDRATANNIIKRVKQAFKDKSDAKAQGYSVNTKGAALGAILDYLELSPEEAAPMNIEDILNAINCK